ncbi:D-isomer specific 2-hydroxyacid dehydrogenase [Annulohypoxylon maeteangense]|uniref:D-isomer specific 2-hydroxyacid dehydrogenase n=1 Tax=Annulohypoxylon maeteangense TaxID=1927788 RepID=UPI002007F931|nr:D-isomer specific 2-hydroxyacid dehydrogenase [Annulohypoxylon maeteangense]KAI0887025.1 D-isomer specific 2-hydroxyacid dehydrogenase [Annulohypoxylon maeteangense]
MSTPPTVLLIGNLAHTNAEWTSLSKKYSLLEFRKGTREQFFENCRNGTYAKVQGCYRSNMSTLLTGPFNKELVDALPESWKYIAHNGAGYDNIDVSACSARHIAVSSTPGIVNDSTADTGIFLMLGALRQAHEPLVALREGRWKGNMRLGHDPRNKVLGILGMGGIGSAMAHRARSLGMEIIYHNRKRLDPSLENGAKYVSFDELLAQADVLSLNLALNASTRHIIAAPELAKMKRGVVVVNTARGALINEAHLVDALESGQVSAVGLDVFENEPEVHPGLVKSNRAFLLPHLGTSTVETQRDMELLVLKNLQAAVDQGKMLTLVSEQRGLDWVPGHAD